MQAYLLRYIPYNDHDALLSVISREGGYQSLYCRGLYSARNKKKPLLYPLSFLNIHISDRQKAKEVKSISRLEAGNNDGMPTGMRQQSLFFFAAEVFYLLRTGAEPANYYREIGLYIKACQTHNTEAPLVLLLRLLMLEGYLPTPDTAEDRFLDAEHGTFIQEENPSCFHKDISEQWLRLLNSGLDYSPANVIGRKAVLKSILQYYSFHLSELNKINSLGVFEEIIN